MQECLDGLFLLCSESAPKLGHIRPHGVSSPSSPSSPALSPTQSPPQTVIQTQPLAGQSASKPEPTLTLNTEAESVPAVSYASPSVSMGSMGVMTKEEEEEEAEEEQLLATAPQIDDPDCRLRVGTPHECCDLLCVVVCKAFLDARLLRFCLFALAALHRLARCLSTMPSLVPLPLPYTIHRKVVYHSAQLWQEVWQMPRSDSAVEQPGLWSLPLVADCSSLTIHSSIASCRSRKSPPPSCWPAVEKSCAGSSWTIDSPDSAPCLACAPMSLMQVSIMGVGLVVGSNRWQKPH